VSLLSTVFLHHPSYMAVLSFLSTSLSPVPLHQTSRENWPKYAVTGEQRGLSAVLHTKLNVLPEIHCLCVRKQRNVGIGEISGFCNLWKTWNYFVHVLPNKAWMSCDNSRHLSETEVTTFSVKAKKHTYISWRLHERILLTPS
jgi:hypothetical protein